MTEIWPGRRAALGGVALCALTVVGGWSDPPALSATERPLPAVAAVVQATTKSNLCRYAEPDGDLGWSQGGDRLS